MEEDKDKEYISKTRAQSILRTCEQEVLSLPGIVGTGIVKGKGFGRYQIGIFATTTDQENTQKAAAKILKESSGGEDVPFQIVQSGLISPEE